MEWHLGRLGMQADDSRRQSTLSEIDVLDRQLAGEGTRAAEALSATTFVAAVRQVLIADEPAPSAHNTFETLRHSLEVRDELSRTVSKDSNVFAWTRQRIMGTAVAASLVIAFVLALPHQQFDASQRFQTLGQQRALIRYADGSTITLAPGTSVTSAARSGQHVMRITGEAAFSLQAHTATAAEVQTTNTVVRVLGTRFSVRHYLAAPASQIVVDEGKVSISALQHQNIRSASVALAAHMAAQITSNGISVSAHPDMPNSIRWTDGMLVFNHVPLRDVIVELKRVYDADIRVSDSTLALVTVHTVVSVREDSLSQVLESVCAIADAHIARQGSIYLLSPGRSTARRPQRQPSHPNFTQDPQYGR